MKRILLALVISFHAHLAWAITIATGPSGGSYFQVAQDIKNIATKDGIDVQVMPTKGSLENIELLTTGKVDLAIVQLDALRFISDVTKKDLGVDVFEKIKVVLNLYRKRSIFSPTRKKSRPSIIWKGNGCRWDLPEVARRLRRRCCSMSTISKRRSLRKVSTMPSKRSSKGVSMP